MKIYLGYIRVSRVGNRSETLISPDLQEDAIESFADRHGVEVEVLPAELDRSGGDDTRPILLGGIERIERGERAGIIVWNFARFTRSLETSLAFLRRIEDVGGELLSTSEQMDPTTVSGRMTRNITFSIRQAEREQKAEEFEVAKASAVERGIWTAPRVPLGYRKRSDRRLEPDPAAAPVVVELFRRRAGGESWSSLAGYVRAALGIDCYGPTVAGLIRRRTYLGEARQGEHVNLAAHEAIVDRATWEAAQLDQPKPARGTRGEAALTGLPRCAGCSFRMGTSYRKGLRFWGCRRYHAGGDCPAPAMISDRLLQPYVIGSLFHHARQLAYTATDRTDALEAAGRTLEQAEAELALFQDSVRLSDVGAEYFQSGMRSRVGDLEAARRTLAAAQLAAPRVLPGTLDEVWPSLSVVERRQVLRSSFSVIWVRRGRGPVADRVRLIADGHEPADLSVQGRPAGSPIAIDWPDGDLEGEVRVAGVEDGG